MAGHYITRTQWGARPAKAWTPMPRPVGTVFIHHSVTPFGADGMCIKLRLATASGNHKKDRKGGTQPQLQYTLYPEEIP